MSLRHPLFHRTIKALFIDVQEAGYEHPTLENINTFKNELLQELEEGVLLLEDQPKKRSLIDQLLIL